MNEYLLFIFTAFVILREFMCVNACVCSYCASLLCQSHTRLFVFACCSLAHTYSKAL